MSTLRIYNVSDYVYAGAAPKSKDSFSRVPFFYGGVRELPDGSYAASKMPTGGISFSLNPIFERIVSEDYNDETLVFCIDDEPTVKRNLYYKIFKDETGYKGNRLPKSVDVSIQRDAIGDILSLFSHNVLFCEGLEADDIIASLVWKYKRSYDEIIIHTRDSDLFSLVDDNVSIGLVGTKGKIVTKGNFSSVNKNKNGEPIPFNGILLDKLFYGDKSDNIPSIPYGMKSKIDSFITKDKYQFLTNVRLLRNWVAKAVDNDFTTLGILDLLLPIEVPEEKLEIYDDMLDIRTLYYIGNRIGNKYCKKGAFIDDGNPKVLEVLNYYTDEYYLRGGRFNG